MTSKRRGDFGTATNWQGGVAPVSGMDSVVLTHLLEMNSEFTIAAGEQMTARSGSLKLGKKGHLTVAKEGRLDFGKPKCYFSEGEAGHLTIEAGASARAYQYWNDDRRYINEWVADAEGVTTFEITDRFTLRGTNSILKVDLSHYDLSNGDTLILVDYDRLLLQKQAEGDQGWSTVVLTPGWSAKLELAYDIDGNGDLGIALTHITAKSGKYVGIPEPGTYALIGGLLALTHVMLRRRR